jgi:hypothetical protein
MTIRGLAVVVLLLTWIMCVRADEWAAPRVQNVFSSNGRYFVRVVPVTTINDDGYFVTFDDWFQMGIGSVMAFYRPTGALIRDVAIEEL